MQSVTILTAEANAFVQSLHHRMPVILDPANASRWLEGDEGMLEDVAAITPELKAWPVDRRVNNARNEGADLIDAVGEAKTG